MYALQQLRNVPNAATARPRRGLRVPCPFWVGYANGPDVNRLERIESRASQVPAAAVIPARQKNIKFVAVEKFVVGPGPATCRVPGPRGLGGGARVFGRRLVREGQARCPRYCEKIEAFQAGSRRNDSHGITLSGRGSRGGQFSLPLLTGTVGGTRTAELEVKFLDFRVTNDCESIYQRCFH